MKWGDNPYSNGLFGRPEKCHHGECCGVFCASCGKCWELRLTEHKPQMICDCNLAQELAFRYFLNECNPAGSPPGFPEGEHSKDERTKT